MPEIVLMHLVEFLMFENLYFATNFMKLPSIEQKLYPFFYFRDCFGGHLEFSHLDMPEFVLMHLVEFLMCKNLHFATNFMKLPSIEQKLWPFMGPASHFGGHLGFSQILTTSEMSTQFFSDTKTTC